MEIEHFVSNLVICQGEGVGQKLELLPWQRRFIRGAFSPNVSTSCLSLARGNGKTVLAAALGLAGFVGPVSQPGAAVVIVASSFSQARICFSHMVSFLKSSVLYQANPKRFGISENSRVCEIIDRFTRSTCRAGGSDPRRLHGTAPVICIIDEPASHTHGNRDAIFAACITSLGKVPNSKLIAVGTKSSDRATGSIRASAAAAVSITRNAMTPQP